MAAVPQKTSVKSREGRVFEFGDNAKLYSAPVKTVDDNTRYYLSILPAGVTDVNIGSAELALISAYIDHWGAAENKVSHASVTSLDRALGSYIGDWDAKWIEPLSFEAASRLVDASRTLGMEELMHKVCRHISIVALNEVQKIGGEQHEKLAAYFREKAAAKKA